MNKKLIDQKQVEKLLSKVKEIQTKNKLDLSSHEDLAIGVMNLISIEEHLFFTAVKTGKIKYLDLLNEVRQMRKTLLKRIIKDYEGELWCISKHLLAATMRLNEVGTKALNNRKKKEAWEFFNMAYGLYSLFWGLNLGIVKTKDMKTDFKENEFINSEKIAKESEGKGLMGRLGEIVKKILNCCRE